MIRRASIALAPRRPAAPALRTPRARFVAGSGIIGVGGYDAGRYDRSATRNWTPRSGSPDADSVPDLGPIRGRTRDLARNAPLVSGALGTHLNCTIGPGLIPHPRLDHKFLGLTPEQALEWQENALRIFWMLAGTTRLDIRRRHTFAQMTWTVFSSWMTDGDHGYRRRYKERDGDILGLKLQLIEADRISNPDNRLDSDTLIEGVELTSSDGELAGFHVSDRHPGDMLRMIAAPKWSYQPAFGPQTGEPLMRLIADIRRDGQTRGVSMLAPVVESVKQLSRYAGAELDAAVATSFVSLLVKTKDGGGLPGMGIGSNQPIVGFQGGPGSASGDRQIELAPAAVIGLLEGEEVSTFNPNRPNPGFDPFFQAYCSIVGAGVDLPHEILIKRFLASFSASRGAMLEAWRGFKTKRAMIAVDQWAQQVWNWIIDECVARGYLAAPHYFEDPIIRAAYNECSWSGPIMGQLNPQQEMAAAKMRVDMAVSTLEEETAEITGGDDWYRKVEQRGREHSKMVSLGLTGELIAERIITEPIQPVPAPDPAGDPTQQTPDQQDATDAKGGEA